MSFWTAYAAGLAKEAPRMPLTHDRKPTDGVGSRRGGGDGGAALAALSGGAVAGRRAARRRPWRRRLRCSRASVYAWAAAWRQDGVAGLREGDHGGGRVKLDAAGEAVLQDLLATDPQRTAIRPRGGRCRCCRADWPQAGYAVGRAHGAPGLAPAGLSLETAAVRAGTSRSGLRRKKGAVIAQAHGHAGRGWGGLGGR